MKARNPLHEAREMLRKPKTEFGWSDIGDILCDYLAGRITKTRALDRLKAMEEDYARARSQNRLYGDA